MNSDSDGCDAAARGAHDRVHAAVPDHVAHNDDQDPFAVPPLSHRRADVLQPAGMARQYRGPGIPVLLAGDMPERVRRGSRLRGRGHTHRGGGVPRRSSRGAGFLLCTEVRHQLAFPGTKMHFLFLSIPIHP